MNDESVEPNPFTFTLLLKACINTGKIGESKQIHGLTLKLGFSGDEFLMRDLVRMHVIYGLMRHMRRLCVVYKNIIGIDMVMVDGRKKDDEVVL